MRMRMMRRWMWVIKGKKRMKMLMYLRYGEDG